MKSILVILGLLFFTESKSEFCKAPVSGKDDGTVCFSKDCLKKIEEQVTQELTASTYYLYHAGFVDNVNENRPGFADFFYKAAAEERDHAILMLDYLNTRGWQTVGETTITVPISENLDYISLLRAARDKEIQVSESIHGIINKCSTDLDFHGADIFTNPIMQEQHEAIRMLQGAIKHYNNISPAGAESQDLKFAEFVTDQKIFSGSI